MTFRLRSNIWLLKLSRRWLRVALVLIGLYAGLPWVAPTLMHFGLEGPAHLLYFAYGPFCHQFAFRSFFLFGDGDAQSRIPEAVAGILLVASTWMLRPYLGRRGTFLAGALLALTPSILYFTRFARHDALLLLWTFWIVIGFFRYLDTGQARYLYLLAIGFYFLAWAFSWNTLPAWLRGPRPLRQDGAH